MLDRCDVTLGFPLRIDFQTPQAVGQTHFPASDIEAKHIAQRMGWIGGHDEASPAAVGGRRGESGRHRRLADAALAPDEDDAAFENGVQTVSST
jgi:hypothetical protein